MKDLMVRPVPHLAEVERYLPGRTIEEIQRLYALKEVIKLASNESAIGPSPRVIERIVKELPEIHRYPEGGGTELKLALARRFELDPEAILLGNGSNEVLELCLRAFVLPGETVISAQITFGMYKIMSKVYGARYLEVPMVEMRYDLEGIARLARKEKARLVFIANPNNPTGLAFGAEELKNFMEEVPSETAVVYDAAYSEYAEDEGIPSGREFLKYPNFIMVRTFSKAYGLAGLRIGWAVMAPDLCAMVERVRQPFNVNRLAMIAALTALEDAEHLQRVVELNRQGRRILIELLREAGLKVLAPSYANFVTFETPIPADEFCELILQQGIIIRSLRSFSLPHHARVNTGTIEEMERFRTALFEVLRCLKL
jgi:histidinol-phosphate aminotransferase